MIIGLLLIACSVILGGTGFQPAKHTGWKPVLRGNDNRTALPQKQRHYIVQDSIRPEVLRRNQLANLGKISGLTSSNDAILRNASVVLSRV